MAFSLLRLLLRQDAFGYQPQLSYKGAQTHKTCIGGICSLAVKVMTLILLVVAVQETLLMEDPEITSFARPLSKQEKQELGSISFAKSGQLMGLLAKINDQFTLIPPEIGRLAAYAEYRSFDNTTQSAVREEIQLQDCQKFLSQKIYDGSNEQVQAIIQYRLASCVDPEDWIITEFKDRSITQDDLKQAYFGFELCGIDKSSNTTCLDEDQLEQWHQQNTLEIYWAYISKSIDFSLADDYFFEEISVIQHSDEFLLGYQRNRTSNMRLYEANFDDSLIDPLNTATDTREYLRLVETQAYNQKTLRLRDSAVWHKAYIDTDKQILKRTRYDCWMLLSDIGGFHDGLFLLIHLMINPLAYLYFLFDFIKGLHQDKGTSSKQRRAILQLSR